MNLQPLQLQTDSLLHTAEKIEVKTREDYNRAAEIIKHLKFMINTIEDQRKTYTAPLDEAKRAIMADCKKLIEPCEAMIKKFISSMLTFQTIEQFRLNAEQKKIDAAAMAQAKKTNTLEVTVPIVNDIKTIKSAGATTTVKKVWTFKLDSLNDVPREYLILDTARVREAIREGKREIPGISIFQVDSLSIR